MKVLDHLLSRVPADIIGKTDGIEDDALRPHNNLHITPAENLAQFILGLEQVGIVNHELVAGRISQRDHLEFLKKVDGNQIGEIRIDIRRQCLH